jgi:hypothetical protein
MLSMHHLPIGLLLQLFLILELVVVDGRGKGVR